MWYMMMWNMRHNQAEGQRLLDHLCHLASASDVPMVTQVRVAANIANGIKHAFKEFQASEILMGLHFHKEINRSFWGEFTRSLYNGLSRQIIVTRILQPLNTIRRYRWQSLLGLSLNPVFIVGWNDWHVWQATWSVV